MDGRRAGECQRCRRANPAIREEINIQNHESQRLRCANPLIWEKDQMQLLIWHASM